jgi:hypothetical protein
VPDPMPLDPWNSRLPDHGPIYQETNLARMIVEPCNAITAFLFVVIVVYFLWKMRGRFREHPFVSICLPILLAGGVGGTVYHALRRYPAMFFLDVIPIVVLVVMGSIYFWIRLRPRLWHILILAAFVSASPLPFVFIVETHVAIVVHYVMLAILVMVPIGIVLVRTRGRHSNLVKLSLVTFGFAIMFRFLDPVSAPVLPGLGTHWLWHSFGAITTALLAEYYYRMEIESIPRLSTPS